MQLTSLTIKIPKPPVIQIALDYATQRRGAGDGQNRRRGGRRLARNRHAADRRAGRRADRAHGAGLSRFPGAGRLQDDGLGLEERAANGGARGTRDDRLRQLARRNRSLGDRRVEKVRRVGRGRHDRRQEPGRPGQAMCGLGRAHDLPALRRRPAQARRRAGLDAVAGRSAAGRLDPHRRGLLSTSRMARGPPAWAPS